MFTLSAPRHVTIGSEIFIIARYILQTIEGFMGFWVKGVGLCKLFINYRWPIFKIGHKMYISKGSSSGKPPFSHFWVGALR